MFPFELDNLSKNSFKYRVSKWGLIVLWLGHLNKIFHISSIPKELEGALYIVGNVL